MKTLADVKQTLAYRDRLVKVLVQATKSRQFRQDIVQTEHGPEMGWSVYERLMMLNEVRAIRQERTGRSIGVSIAEIERFDRQAAGHCDWAEKFSLYCAEYAMQEQP